MKVDAAEVLTKFRYWHLLEAEMVSLVIDRKPGVYLIKRDERVVYAGRSDTDVMSRLMRQCSTFVGCHFSVLYVKNKLKRARSEYSLIGHLRKVGPLDNKVNASIPYR